MPRDKLRGFTIPQQHGPTPPKWEERNLNSKVAKSIALMSNDSFVPKRGRTGGQDALLLRLELEPTVVAAIKSTPLGREAAIHFITALYRSEDRGHSSQTAKRAEELFALDYNGEEREKVRDAELDAIAFALSTPYVNVEEWTQGLTDEEKDVVVERAGHYK